MRQNAPERRGENSMKSQTRCPFENLKANGQLCLYRNIGVRMAARMSVRFARVGIPTAARMSVRFVRVGIPKAARMSVRLLLRLELLLCHPALLRPPVVVILVQVRDRARVGPGLKARASPDKMFQNVFAPRRTWPRNPCSSRCFPMPRRTCCRRF